MKLQKIIPPLLLVTFMAISYFMAHPADTFDKDEWLAAYCSKDRKYMVSVLKINHFPGMSKEQVHELLGPTDLTTNASWGKCEHAYCIKDPILGFNIFLLIKFDDSGKYAGTEYLTDS